MNLVLELLFQCLVLVLEIVIILTIIVGMDGLIGALVVVLATKLINGEYKRHLLVSLLVDNLPNLNPKIVQLKIAVIGRIMTLKNGVLVTLYLTMDFKVDSLILVHVMILPYALFLLIMNFKIVFLKLKAIVLGRIYSTLLLVLILILINNFGILKNALV